VDIIAESAQPLTNTIALKDYLCRGRRSTDEYFRNLGWSLPPSPQSVFWGKGGSAILYPTPVSISFGITASAILSTGDYRHWSRVRGTTPTCRSGSLTIG